MVRRISVLLASVLILSLLVAGAAFGREAVGTDPAPAAQSSDGDDGPTLSTASAVTELSNQFGRTIVTARSNIFLVDSAPPLGHPSEEMNPVEAMLASLATCGLVVYEAAAQEMDIPLSAASMTVQGDFRRARSDRRGRCGPTRAGVPRPSDAGRPDRSAG